MKHFACFGSGYTVVEIKRIKQSEVKQGGGGGEGSLEDGTKAPGPFGLLHVRGAAAQLLKGTWERL